MAMTLSLQPSSLKKNQRACIVGFLGPLPIIERLQELGLHKGDEITFVGRAPMRGPLLLRLGATVLALRQEEAQCLQIQVL
jgi:Fe2+ transport system protein FeoA